MFTSTSEETGRLDSEVSNLFFATIECTMRVRSLKLILCFLEFLLLGSCHRFLDGFFRFEVFEHRSEVTQLEFLDLNAVFLEFCKKRRDGRG